MRVERLTIRRHASTMLVNRQSLMFSPPRSENESGDDERDEIEAGIDAPEAFRLAGKDRGCEARPARETDPTERTEERTGLPGHLRQLREDDSERPRCEQSADEHERVGDRH